jgi:hypothetical protein
MPDVEELISRAAPGPITAFDADDLVRRVRRRRTVRRRALSAVALVVVAGIGLTGVVVVDGDDGQVQVGDTDDAVTSTADVPTTTAPDPGSVVGPAVTVPTWRAAPSLPGVGAGVLPPTVVVTDDEVVVWGTGVGVAVRLEDATTRAVPPAPIEARRGAVGTWTGDEVLVWGGVGEDGAELVDGAAWDPDTGAWRTLPAAPLGTGRPLVAVWTGRELVLSGVQELGAVPVAGAAGAAYDPANDSWRTIAEAPPLHQGTGFWTGTHVAVVGAQLDTTGQANGASRTLLYDPGADAWELWPANGLSPEALWAAWDGRSIVYWDGTEPRFDDRTAEAARWDPAVRAAGRPLDGFEVLPPPPVEADGCVPGGVAGEGILATYCDQAVWWDGSTWNRAAPPAAFAAPPVAVPGGFLAWLVDPADPDHSQPYVLRVPATGPGDPSTTTGAPTTEPATTGSLPVCGEQTTATVVAGEPVPPPTTAPPCVEPEPTELEQIRAELEAEFALAPPMISLGTGDDAVEVGLRADGAARAAELLERYGDDVRVQVGFFPYPDPGDARPTGGCERPPAPAGQPGLETEIVVDRPPAHPGDWGEGRIELRNVGAERIQFLTGTATGLLLGPDGEVAGAYEGGVTLAGVGVDLAPGESTSLRLFIGTASCDPTAGYAVPSGTYDLVAVLAPGVVTAPAPLVIPGT